MQPLLNRLDPAGEIVKLLEFGVLVENVSGGQPLQSGDVDRTFADVTKAEKELGYKPSTDIRIGLARFVEWLRSEHRPR